MEAFGLTVEEDIHSDHRVSGRRGMNWKMASGTKRNLDESGSLSPDVEANERSSKSGTVRDP